MNGDLSRVTFDPLKHFTSVVVQQGRVQVDSDANEQAAILLHYLRRLAADLIGPFGGPADVFSKPGPPKTGLLERNCGFAMIAAKAPAAAGAPITYFPPDDLLQDEKDLLAEDLDKSRMALVITSGNYYVDGLLCENEIPRHYLQQPDRVQADDAETANLSGIRLFYLDVWERHITALEDPLIREVALGGADTAARRKLIWQVRIAREPLGAGPPPIDCTNFNWPSVLSTLEPANRGKLRAQAKRNDGAGGDYPCITSPEARFRGMENQLYRVEVHRSGPALNNTDTNRDVAATFKWSRDNGTGIATFNRKDGDRLIVSGLRDFSRWFRADNWVEITHDALELNGLPGPLVRLAKVEGETLTIDPNTTSETITEPGSKVDDLPVSHLKVRRWDHQEPNDTTLLHGAIPIREGVWLELEDGVSIWFETGTSAANYRAGDYWLIPARVSTGDVEWPLMDVPDKDDKTKVVSEPKPLPPHGIQHHYAPLAAVTLDLGNITKVVDLRHKFPALGVC